VRLESLQLNGLDEQNAELFITSNLDNAVPVTSNL
jgi:hypothetical protein